MLTKSRSIMISFVVSVMLLLNITTSPVSFAKSTERPLATATKTPTAILGQVTGRVLRNANLRAGPGKEFAVIGTVTARQTLVIVGSNAKGDWYRLENGMWIAAFLVGGLSKPVPVLLATDESVSPIQTATPINSPTPESSQTSQAIPTPTTNADCPPPTIDACLVGTWRREMYKVTKSETMSGFDQISFNADGSFLRQGHILSTGLVRSAEVVVDNNTGCFASQSISTTTDAGEIVLTLRTAQGTFSTWASHEPHKVKISPMFDTVPEPEIWRYQCNGDALRIQMPRSDEVLVYEQYVK